MNTARDDTFLRCCDVIVDPRNDPVVGHAAHNRSQVLEYLGIPYAKPSIESFRFAALAQYTRPLNSQAQNPLL
ncbi:hypothetical protein BJ546DRAFT_981269, partial [Cryomyces antarcticus]